MTSIVINMFPLLSTNLILSLIQRCVDTSLAVSRFVLSLDPLRDPMGLLMTIDYFALATMNEKDLQFLIDLVESQTVNHC